MLLEELSTILWKPLFLERDEELSSANKANDECEVRFKGKPYVIKIENNKIAIIDQVKPKNEGEYEWEEREFMTFERTKLDDLENIRVRLFFPSNGSEYSELILNSIPKGIWSLVGYALSKSLTFPFIG